MTCLNRSPPNLHGILCSVNPICIGLQSVSYISYCTYLVSAHNSVNVLQHIYITSAVSRSFESQ